MTEEYEEPGERVQQAIERAQMLMDKVREGLVKPFFSKLGQRKRPLMSGVNSFLDKRILAQGQNPGGEQPQQPQQPAEQKLIKCPNPECGIMLPMDPMLNYCPKCGSPLKKQEEDKDSQEFHETPRERSPKVLRK